MSAELKETPRAGLVAQPCGDAHLSNFGVFASPERNLLLDLNDFDETHPEPFERCCSSAATKPTRHGASATRS
ncbi:MAG: DUF2252 family protein [Mycetocola sp.]